MSLMPKLSWEMLFFESGDTGVFKADRNRPFASNMAFVLTAIIYSSSNLPNYMMSLTLYTPISECIFSILFSIYFKMCWQGEFV